MCDEGRDCGTSDSLTLLFEEKGNVDGMGVQPTRLAPGEVSSPPLLDPELRHFCALPTMCSTVFADG